MSKKPDGRPSKKLIDRRSKTVKARLNTDEYYTLKSKCQKAGVTVSEALRDLLKQGYIKERFTPEQAG